MIPSNAITTLLLPARYQLKLLFWRRLNRQDEEGLFPLSLRITVAGQRAELDTFIRLPAAYWPAGSKQILLPASRSQRHPERDAGWVDEMNGRLAALKGAADQLYRELRKAPDAPRNLAKAVHAALRGEAAAPPPEQPSLSLLEVGALFLAWAQGGTSDREPATLKSYSYRLRVLARFLEESEQNKHLKVTAVKMPLARRYERWCLEQGGHGLASMRKQLNMLQMVVAFGAAEGHLDGNTLFGYRYQSASPVTTPVFVPAHEIQKLRAARYAQPPYYAVTDAWLFCCYTGLSWADYLLFDPARHLQTHEDGSVWLHMVRRKMKKRKPEGFWVPILAEAQELLTRYRGVDGVVKLPKLCGTYANKRLKQITQALDLSLPLTCKLARSTFAQRMRDQGVAPHIVCAMMGDTPQVIEKHYSRERLVSIAAEVRTRFGAEAVTVKEEVVSTPQPEEGGRIIQFRFGA
ncbi:MAG TPA: hypothetical protein VF598_00310 [Hymenobacter sp.]|jgi:hypothetical protein